MWQGYSLRFGSGMHKNKAFGLILFYCTLVFADSDIYEVVSQPFASTVEVVGQWAPLTWYPLRMPLTAKLERIHQPFGVSVEAKTKLFTFSQPDLDLKIHELLWEVQDNQAQMKKIEKWQHSQEYLSAKTDVRLSEKDCEAKKHRAEETKKLVDLGGLPREQLALDENAYDRCLYQLDMTRNRFHINEEKGSKQALYAARIALKKSKRQLEKVQMQKAQLNVVAPVSGVFLSPRLFQSGDQIPLTEGQDVSEERWLGVIASDDAFGVELQLSAVALEHIEQAQTVEVLIHGTGYKGEIQSIQPQSIKQDNQAVRYQVQIALKERPATPPRIGYQAKVRFLGPQQSVVQIPLQAIHWEHGHSYVSQYDTKTKIFKEKAIQVGALEPPFAEVVQGLEQGDRIGLTSQRG